METPHRPVWRKSSYSDNNGGACVEVARTPLRILVRDSKDATGPVLRFKGQRWSAFLASLKH
ncbi:DUF397 domain-containing protein [Micromonospora andamanensis]|uniref:DUF397 domain-containing protein n=1 Tax=Micromonospora andamanensis TaxID=1287068 RepID=A0ABQ4I041_9ACTN|nr:DUF397 domain-containing protein [Micromonospora andamanensis]GIJ11289.1 hypothetical protein Van01_45030 [Micromonospora andamanensis]